MLYLAAQFALFRPFDYYRGVVQPTHYNRFPDSLAALARAQCDEQPCQGAGLLCWLRRRQGRPLAGSAAAGGAAGDLLAHDAGKQASAVGTAAPVENIGPMILLVRRAPYSHALAGPAEMCRLTADAMRHLAPVAIIDPAKVAAEIAGHDVVAAGPCLIAHRILPCNARSMAPRCALALIRQKCVRRQAGCTILIVTYIAAESSIFLCKIDIFMELQL
jgi:hypothetical protein